MTLELLNVFGTETPTIEMVDYKEIPDEIFDYVSRGKGGTFTPSSFVWE